MVDENIFLKKILSSLGKENLLQGNEDAVAIDISTQVKSSKILVVNTDSMAWSTDALPPDISLFDFGRKLVTMTVSDVIVKGALPKYFLSNITVPNNFTENKMTEVFNGMEEGCNQYNISYLGGDLGNSKELVISGFVIGFSNKDGLLKRSNAQENDYVCTTGHFGYTGLGYKHYLDKDSPIKGDLGLLKLVNQKLSKPKALVEWLPYLIKYCNATIDSSDGLINSLQHIANESNKAIYLKTLPINQKLLKNKKIPLITLNEAVMFGGEEYEFIFTISKVNYSKLIAKFKESNLEPPIQIGIIKIGKSEVFFGNKVILDSGRSWDSIKGFK